MQSRYSQCGDELFSDVWVRISSEGKGEFQTFPPRLPSRKPKKMTVGSTHSTEAVSPRPSHTTACGSCSRQMGRWL